MCECVYNVCMCACMCACMCIRVCKYVLECVCVYACALSLSGAAWLQFGADCQVSQPGAGSAQPERGVAHSSERSS